MPPTAMVTWFTMTPYPAWSMAEAIFSMVTFSGS